MALTPTVHRPTRTIWWPELGLLSGFVVLTGALAAGQLLGVDLAVRDWCDAHQQGVVRTGAWALNVLGSATLLAPIAFVLAVVVAVRSRSVRPVLPVVTAVVAANLLIVPLKMLCDRAAPHSPAPDPVLIFHHPPGWSYPSGHVANAVYLYGALLVVVDALRPVPPAVRRLVRVAPPVIVSATVTYLGYHWLTDALAGLLLGLLLDRLLRRIPWDRNR